MAACSIEATYLAVDAGVIGRYRDQYLPGSRIQNARQSAGHRVEFFVTLCTGYNPAASWGNPPRDELLPQRTCPALFRIVIAAL